MMALSEGAVTMAVFLIAVLAVWWAVVAFVLRSSRRKDRQGRP
jgi:hypothetical protein